MREIKYRVYDEKGRKMLSFDVLQRFALLGLIFTEENKYKAMQYTGLKDKNGVEIYEGDVIHFKHNQMAGLGFVYFNEEVAQWWIKDIREVTKKRGQRYYPFWKDCQYRIDGNIYENPELLETKKSS